MSLTLYGPKSHLNAATRPDIVAKFLGIPLEHNRIPFSEIKSPEYLQKNPHGKIPVLETPDGCIYESLAIIRYLARKSGKMYGNTPGETAAIDQWLEFSNTQLAGIIRILHFGLFGFLAFEMTKEKFNQAKKELIEMMKVIDAAVKKNGFLASKQMSVADALLPCILRYSFCLIFDEKTRGSFPNATEWFVKMCETPEYREYFGKTWLCQKEFVPDFEDLAKRYKAAEEAKKPKKEEKKKEEPKKKEKKEKKGEEQEEQEEEEKPKKKEANPLDLLPKSNFILDDFKRDFVNDTDLREACKKFWEKYDPQGYSLWKLHYVLYEGEGKVGYLTCNLKNGFIRNLDHFRKYSFGVIGVYGEEGALGIEGCMMWRGTEIPNQWKQHNAYDYFEFTKLDHTDPAHRKLVEEYWVNVEGKEEGLVEGKPLYEGKWFK